MLLFPLLFAAVTASTDWTRFGGPSGSFHLNDSEIQKWPSGGPKKLWARPLGEGYSGIVVSGSRLFTMFREGSSEVVLALDAASGKTVWEYRYEAPVLAAFANYGGNGPRATPLLEGGQLFTAGANGKLHCFDPATGKVVWRKDLYTDFGGSVRNSGYSPSPFAAGGRIIVFPGAPNAAIAALRPADGSVAWNKQSFTPGFATPIRIVFPKREQIVTTFAKEVAGLDPATGEVLWTFPHGNSEQVNVAQPVDLGNGTLFLSSAYDGSCRLIRIAETAGKFSATEVWGNRFLRIHHTNAIRANTMILGANGDFGPVPLTALDADSGKLLWRDRTFPKASLICLSQDNGGTRILILDEEGTLALGVAQPSGLTVLGKTSVLSSPAWTAPAVSGKRVYVRDQRTIAAYAFE